MLIRSSSNDHAWTKWLTHWPWGVLMLLLLLQWFCIRRDIDASSSYPQHTDQRHLAHPAQKILESGSLNPKRFNYPSVPVYLTAAGMSLGILEEQRNDTRKEALKVDKLGSVHKPYIKYPRVVNGARKLFGLVSLLIVALTGWLGRRLYGRHFLWAAPAILILSRSFYFLSWGYLNVDLLAACGAALTLATLVTAEGTTRVSDRIVIPAICAGFAIACKYTMAVTLLPLLLSVWLFDGPFKIRRSVLAVTLTCVTFAVLCPFSLLDLPRFVNDVGYEVWHYAVRGHTGQAAEPGAHQLWLYIQDFASEFTWPGVVLIALGIVRGTSSRPRASLLCLSFFAALMWLLAGQVVHFSRNVTPVLSLLAIWLVVGATWVYSSLPLALSKIRRLGARPVALRWTTRGLATLALFGMFWGRPFTRLVNRAQAFTESRTEFVDWARENLEEDTVLHIPRELDFDDRPLKRHLKVKRFAVDQKDHKQLERTAKRHGEYVLLPHWSDSKRRSASRKLCGKQVHHIDGRQVAKLLTVNPELDVLKLGPCSKKSQ